MNDISTVQRLRDMKMNAFASELERQLADNAKEMLIKSSLQAKNMV